MPKRVRIKRGTTIVVAERGDGDLELVVYSEREAHEQHLDRLTRESHVDDGAEMPETTD